MIDTALLNTRLNRIQRLARFKLRLIKTSGSLEAAKQTAQWDNIELLISVIKSRINTQLEADDINTPLTAGEIVFINFLLNQLQDL